MFNIVDTRLRCTQVILVMFSCYGVFGNTCIRTTPLVPRPENVGKILIRTFINFGKAASLEVCGQNCLKDTRCLSINYDSGQELCYLNFKIKSNARTIDFMLAPSSLVFMERSELSEVSVLKKLYSTINNLKQSVHSQ